MRAEHGFGGCLLDERPIFLSWLLLQHIRQNSILSCLYLPQARVCRAGARADGHLCLEM